MTLPRRSQLAGEVLGGIDLLDASDAWACHWCYAQMGANREDTPMRTVNVSFHVGTRDSRAKSKARKHTFPRCMSTGLARYRDRHQARDGARALSARWHQCHVSMFACPDCRGWHVEKTDIQAPILSSREPETATTSTPPSGSRKRRYVLVDVENPTRGARATREEVGVLWHCLKQQAPGIAPEDHVVVGASRRVARKYRASMQGKNVRWVIGADAPEAADRALIAAIDLYRVARDYDELVIVSGDHAFAALARRAKQLGLSVHVVTAEHPAERTMLSRELAATADTQTLIRLDRRVPGNVTPIPTQGLDPRSPRLAPRQRIAG